MSALKSNKEKIIAIPRKWRDYGSNGVLSNIYKMRNGEK
jgi:hypothetical protein